MLEAAIERLVELMYIDECSETSKSADNIE